MNEFTENVLTEQGFHTENTLYFNNLIVTNHLKPVKINDKLTETLLHRSDDLKIELINIDGRAVFEAPIDLYGGLNNISITTENILLKEGEQYLHGELRANEIDVNDFQTLQINKMDLNYLRYLSMKSPEIENIENLTVENLVLDGLLNGVDIGVLDKYALKIQGDQEITAVYNFNELTVDNLQTDSRFLQDFVKINEGEYRITYDVLFQKTLYAKNLIVKHFLNDINVGSDGELKMLLRNSSKVQFIDGVKEIETVTLGEVKFRGKVLSKLLEKMNPVRHIKKPIVIKRDFVFKKGVNIEKILQTKKLVNKDGSLSIERLFQKGLKINDINIPVQINLLQSITVDNINATTINGINTRNFVVTGTNETQIISGAKTILNDLYVTDTTKALSINNINLKQLEDTVMKLEGNQIITGKLIIANLTANTINTKNAQVGKKFWSNVLTTHQNQVIAGRTTIKNLKANNFESTFLYSHGTINGYNFSDIVDDSIMYSEVIDMVKPKHFINLTVDELTTHDNYSYSDFLQLVENVELPFIEIENLTLNGTCNGIAKENFNNALSLQFNNITILGGLQIDSDYINSLKIEDLVNKTVKRDESFHFENAIFGR